MSEFKEEIKLTGDMIEQKTDLWGMPTYTTGNITVYDDHFIVKEYSQPFKDSYRRNKSTYEVWYRDISGIGVNQSLIDLKNIVISSGRFTHFFEIRNTPKNKALLEGIRKKLMDYVNIYKERGTRIYNDLNSDNNGMFCKHCGKKIDTNSTFCKYCGGKQ